MYKNGFIDSYNIKWVLMDENKLIWEEEYKNMSLADFEILYGENVHHIIEIEMRLTDDSLSCGYYDNRKNEGDRQIYWGM